MGQNNEKSLNFHSNANASIESSESFSYSRDENFSEEDFLEISPVYLHNYSIDFNDSDNINNSNFIERSPINYGNSIDINESKENASNSQQNNLIIEIGNKNNNYAAIETPFISEETIFPNSTNKEKNHLGRKKKEEKVNYQEGSSHDMFQNDNMSAKIQRHFLNFIISFLNCLFLYFNYNKMLFKLDKNFKINIKKKNFENLNNQTIGDIISNKISSKYSSINDKAEANKKICEEIKNNPVLNEILSEKYLVFFKKFYYKSDSYINLKDYGLDKDIIFTKDVKNFKHLLKENEKRGDKYIMYIKRHVLKKYLPGSIFIC